MDFLRSQGAEVGAGIGAGVGAALGAAISMEPTELGCKVGWEDRLLFMVLGASSRGCGRMQEWQWEMGMDSPYSFNCLSISGNLDGRVGGKGGGVKNEGTAVTSSGTSVVNEGTAVTSSGTSVV
uniref:Gly-zipper_YMGG domain-containing protein n=1 Tax=Strongyloides papillosus TaxID=174720 RepID=A0A0N5BI41_STREA